MGALTFAACGDPNDPVTIGRLIGQVRNAANQAPLSDATVTVAGRTGQTGGDGRFEIDSVPAGTHEITAEAVGFVTGAIQAEIRPGMDNLWDLELDAIQPPGLMVAMSSLPPGTVDQLYVVTLQATGGTPPYVWAGGNAETGLSIIDGVLRGTPGYPAGTYDVLLEVRDAASALARRTLTLEIGTESGLRALGGALEDGEVGVPYSDQVGAEGGSPPYTFELAPLLNGLQLDEATGAITGTPTGGTGPLGEPAHLRLLVRDVVGASAFTTVSIGIVPAPVVIASDLPDGEVEVFYEEFLSSTGGFGSLEYYTIINGSLPPGLDITSPESLFGSRLHGTPTLPGVYQFTMQVSVCTTTQPPACTPPQIATRDYEMVITGSTLSIVTTTLPDGAVGSPYSAFLVREGGTGPFAWDVVSGSLPPGMSLTTAGEVTGTPGTAGDFAFEVRVQDAGVESATANLALHVEP